MFCVSLLDFVYVSLSFLIVAGQIFCFLNISLTWLLLLSVCYGDKNGYYLRVSNETLFLINHNLFNTANPSRVQKTTTTISTTTTTGKTTILTFYFSKKEELSKKSQAEEQRERRRQE